MPILMVKIFGYMQIGKNIWVYANRVIFKKAANGRQDMQETSGSCQRCADTDKQVFISCWLYNAGCQGRPKVINQFKKIFHEECEGAK